ncbi:DUF1236 domain-containing protein [Devosia aurantiaca]|uniref:DUF1236 domain-containing protein n=1 Tax=Devosia aurantiaca TaxID=2714858 RepID=A0A6M1SJ21_9HYPH|nr:DUF1236 domain-containing protein [Devosia aurantiaca]NGP17100.1 DUF1236 domain-containing protein [Devosia aurantiaca]
MVDVDHHNHRWGRRGADRSTSTDASATTGSKTSTTTDSGSTDDNATTRTDANAETTTEAGADGAAAADANASTDVNVEVTTEQQTEIRTAITEVQVQPVTVSSIDFDISIGVAVPQRITLQPLPVRIVELVPAYEGYLFFLLDDGRIVIVNPDSLKIVLIINA